MDHGNCDGHRSRTCARHETISTVARHFPRQCSAHSMGISYVRNHRHLAVPDLVVRSDRPSTSVRAVAALLCAGRNRVPVAMRHHVDNVVECARHTFAVQSERLQGGRYQVSH